MPCHSSLCENPQADRLRAALSESRGEVSRLQAELAANDRVLADAESALMALVAEKEALEAAAAAARQAEASAKSQVRAHGALDLPLCDRVMQFRTYGIRDVTSGLVPLHMYVACSQVAALQGQLEAALEAAVSLAPSDTTASAAVAGAVQDVSAVLRSLTA